MKHFKRLAPELKRSERLVGMLTPPLMRWLNEYALEINQSKNSVIIRALELLKGEN